MFKVALYLLELTLKFRRVLNLILQVSSHVCYVEAFL